ncbi:hypothetical protein [Micromonospora sp. NPDC003816]|uniref:hypothetical protein n=1 Tax=Micromonospora sp. NPDC003816 TaxID=3364224 RepID=UPI0036BE29BF
MTDQHTAPPPHPDRTGRRLRAGGALLCTAVLLGALVGSSAPAAVVVKDEHFISAQTPGVLDIEGGECFDDPVHLPEAGGAVVRYRPCASTADNQTYGFVHADDDADWAPAALGEFAWGACRDCSPVPGPTLRTGTCASIRCFRPRRPGRPVIAT